MVGGRWGRVARKRRRKGRGGKWLALIIALLAVPLIIWAMWTLSQPISTVRMVQFPTPAVRVTPTVPEEIQPAERKRLENLLREQGKMQGKDAPGERRQRPAS